MVYTGLYRVYREYCGLYRVYIGVLRLTIRWVFGGKTVDRGFIGFLWFMR